MAWKERIWEVIPFVAMITVECVDVGQITLSKAVMSKGMSPFVYVVYFNALGTLLLFPSFLFQRKQHPPLTLPIICRFILLGLISICFGQMLLYIGVRYSSPTLASSLANLIPIFTFLLAIIFRMEKFNLRRSSTQVKSLGTIVTILGAFIVTFYMGPPIIIFRSSSPSLHHLLLFSQSNWVVGGFLLMTACLFCATLYIFQASTMKEYPSETNLVFFSSLFGSSLAAIFSLIIEKEPNAWKLKSKMEFIAIVYSAMFGTLYRGMVHAWGVHNKGPVYVSMFQPLGIIISIAMGVTILHDTLHIGSVIGAIVIALGFYAVIWGKAEEEKLLKNKEVLGSESPTQRTPFFSKKVSDMVS